MNLDPPPPVKKKTTHLQTCSLSLHLFAPHPYPYPTLPNVSPTLQLRLQALPWQLSQCLPSNRLYSFTGEKKGGEQTWGRGGRGGCGGCGGCGFLVGACEDVTAARCSSFIESDSSYSLSPVCFNPGVSSWKCCSSDLVLERSVTTKNVSVFIF